MNFVKKFLVKRRIRSRIKTLKKVGALLLPILDLFIRFWLLAS